MLNLSQACILIWAKNSKQINCSKIMLSKWTSIYTIFFRPIKKSEDNQETRKFRTIGKSLLRYTFFQTVWPGGWANSESENFRKNTEHKKLTRHPTISGFFPPPKLTENEEIWQSDLLIFYDWPSSGQFWLPLLFKNLALRQLSLSQSLSSTRIQLSSFQ